MKTIKINDEEYCLKDIGEELTSKVTTYRVCCNLLSEISTEIQVYKNMRSSYFSDLRKEILASKAGLF